MLLERRDAILYGGAGSIGSDAHLAGRTLASLEAVAGEFRAAGRPARDGGGRRARRGRRRRPRRWGGRTSGSLDVSFNLISHGDLQGTSLAELALSDFERPVHNAVRTMFLTARAAARHMIRQGSGVIRCAATTWLACRSRSATAPPS